ncbi:MAG: protein kinase, partial [Planctomycetes bacterium]|nr:protein kinase [Planctomycetota bacterium]
LSHANSKGILHRDIKPAHIYISTFGSVCISGWNNACDERQNERTAIGTPIYMSPEQARAEEVDHLSDIYSLGCCLFHLLCLRPPLPCDDLDSFWELKKAGIYKEANSEEELRIPQQLLNIAYTAMHADKTQRYQLASDISEALQYYQEQELNKQNAKQKKKRSPVILILACLIVITGIVTLSLKSQEKADTIKNTHVIDINLATQSLPDLALHWTYSYTYNSSPDGSKDLGTVTTLSLADDTLSISATDTAQELSYQHKFAHNMNISWKQKSSIAPVRFHCFIAGNNAKNAYRYQTTSQGKQLSIQLYRLDTLLSTQTLAMELKKDTAYVLQMNKEGQQVSLSINGKIVHNYSDPESLTGSQHQQFGFICPPHTQQSYQDIRIKNVAQKTQTRAISIANNYFANQLFADARDHYHDIINNYANTKMHARALYGYARCLSLENKATDAIQSYQAFLQQYPQHALREYALYYYLLELGKNKQWAECQKILSSDHTVISLDGLRRNLALKLRSYTADPKLSKEAGIKQLDDTVAQVFTKEFTNL